MRAYILKKRLLLPFLLLVIDVWHIITTIFFPSRGKEGRKAVGSKEGREKKEGRKEDR